MDSWVDGTRFCAECDEYICSSLGLVASETFSLVILKLTQHLDGLSPTEVLSWGLALNENTPSSLLDALVNSTFNKVRRAIAKHENTSRKTLLKLLKDSDSKVVKYANERIEK